MIYFDNSATTLLKPAEVSEAVAYGIRNFGNASRSFYDAAMLASREIYKTREAIARLVGLDEPLNVAFTSSATESLNLVIGGLINKDDAVITTVMEHNSVLRPLYLRGCRLDFINCEDNGALQLDNFEELVRPETRFLICTHGSNVTGNITDVKKLYELCLAHNLTMILDVSQTLGVIPVSADMAHILCFTGHKGLFGPQGTGGIIANGRFNFEFIKTGGAGANSFAPFQQEEMPECFEVGTQNSHSIYGLQKGVEFVLATGVDKIREKEKQLTKVFIEGVSNIKSIKLYGDFSTEDRLPVVALNIDGLTSSELSLLLWKRFEIATRSGSHCAPLLHQRMGTRESGMVRFSFSYLNSEEEIEKGIEALKNIAETLGE